jgi:hypothetical protein
MTLRILSPHVVDDDDNDEAADVDVKNPMESKLAIDEAQASRSREKCYYSGKWQAKSRTPMKLPVTGYRYVGLT